LASSQQTERQQEAVIERHHGNTIEQLFAKLKALLRKAGARTKEVLWTTIGEMLDAFSPEECRNYLRNCG
ncbi:hypothetical protein ILT44_29515, partial [Microvirga sp. BT689]|nr:hypothetical protein [Microvirga arvi]